jgi:hypothetical protein
MLLPFTRDGRRTPVKGAQRREPQAPAAVLDAPDEADSSTARECYRATHRLAVSVMEKPKQYVVAYSLGDLHRLTFLSHEDRAAVQNEWDAWHRKHARLGVVGTAVWLAGAAAAWMLWFQTELLTGVIGTSIGAAVPQVWLRVPAMAVTLGVLMWLPKFLAVLSAPTMSHSYLRGYADGLTRGVNRALHITPEVEQEMWDELRRAERLDESWRRVAESTAAGTVPTLTNG